MRKFILPPDSDSYQVTDGKDAIYTELGGGLGRYRLDVLGASFKVRCQWSLDRADYDYFRAFFKSFAEKGGLPFLVDLIIDASSIEEHTAYFIPDSVRLIRQEGHLYVVAADLEVRPIPREEGYDEIIVVLYEAYGASFEQQAITNLDLLEQLVNVDLPAI